MKTGGAQRLCPLVELTLQAGERRLLQVAGAHHVFGRIRDGFNRHCRLPAKSSLRVQESSLISPGAYLNAAPVPEGY